VGCGADSEEPVASEAALDFRGNYQIDHGDGVSVTLSIGQVEYWEDGIQGQVTVVSGIEIDMGEICDLEGVHCPSEIYWPEVGFDQPYFDPTEGGNTWLVQMINLSHLAHQLQVGGLVNAQGDLTVLLGFDAQAAETCGLLPGSISTADFELDASGEPTGNLLNGRIKAVYSGACILSRDPAMADATIAFETTFSGFRTGKLNLPDSVENTPAFDENGRAL
jgi:hypothetical protein